MVRQMRDGRRLKSEREGEEREGPEGGERPVLGGYSSGQGRQCDRLHRRKQGRQAAQGTQTKGRHGGGKGEARWEEERARRPIPVITGVSIFLLLPAQATGKGDGTELVI